MNKEQSFLKIPFLDKIKKLSVGNKLLVIIALIILLLISEFFIFWLAIKVTSGIRIYVNNEGLYSKGQKEAYSSLIKYYTSFNESDYNDFLRLLQDYPIGTRNFRLELNKKNPSDTVLKELMAKQGQNPNDFNDAIWLYKWFHNVGYMNNAVQVWEVADAKIAEFLAVGQNIHALINTPYDKNDLLEQSTRIAQLSSLIDKEVKINEQLTVIENNFSEVIGQASRSINNILLLVSLFLSISLGAFVVAISLLISRTLVQVDTAKSEFVSWASHQLRTPITSVKWRSEMLLKGKVGELNDKQRGYIEEIYHGNERMIKLVGSLLSMAHIEMGKFKIVVKQVDIKSLLSDIIKEQQQEIEKRNQTVTINEANPTPAIFSDPILITNIFQNLLSNAIKYTPVNGQISCTIKTQEGKVQFEFKDNGIGIPEAEQKRIFEKTFRASNALEQNREGNGLGMYIIKGMIEALGGKIWFKSKLNEGTTFYLELPVKN